MLLSAGPFLTFAFNTWISSKYSPDFSPTYFAHFISVEVPLCIVCYNLFSGVKLSIKAWRNWPTFLAKHHCSRPNSNVR